MEEKSRQQDKQQRKIKKKYHKLFLTGFTPE